MIRATSETGATYDLEEGFWRHREGEWHRVWAMKNVDYDEARAFPPGSELFWNYINTQENSTMPQVGMSLFVTSKDHWRISTPIVKVEKVRT